MTESSWRWFANADYRWFLISINEFHQYKFSNLVNTVFRRIIVPNDVISDETIMNSILIDEKVRKFTHFNISYNSDIDLDKKIICGEAERTTQLP